MSKEFFCRDRDVYQAWIWDGTFKDAPEWVLDKVASGDIREDVGWDEGHHQGERVLLYSDGFCRDDEDEPEVDEMGIGDILTVAFTGGRPNFLSHCAAGEFASQYEVVDEGNVEDRTRAPGGYRGYYAKGTSGEPQLHSKEIDFLREQNKALRIRVSQQVNVVDFLLKHVSENFENSKEILSAFRIEEREEDEDLGEE